MSAFMKSLLRRADLGRASHQPPIRHPATPLATPLEATPLDTQPLQPPHWTPSRCAHRSLDVQSPFPATHSAPSHLIGHPAVAPTDPWMSNRRSCRTPAI